MRYTTINSTGFSNGVINSIKVLMVDNNVNYFDLNGTVFYEKAGWKGVELRDNEIIIKRLPTDFIKKEWEHDLEYTTMIDLLALQRIAYEKLSTMFSYEAESLDKYER
jgi:hypothetical protein